MRAILLLVSALAALAAAQKNPNWWGGRNTIVHLFEWKFSDIASECENYLAPNGFAGVQTSPINEYIDLLYNDPPRPWWERYQPISYMIISRSGNRAQFADMVRRCNNVGVRVYVDVVFNHMTSNWPFAEGYGGSFADTYNNNYPGVPYAAGDFHTSCAITNYDDAKVVRNCEVSGLHDLDQSHDYVRRKIVDYLNTLVDNGVAGFRVDAAKYMWPADLEYIYSQVKNLNTQWFASNTRPFFYQEVVDQSGNEGVHSYEYTSFRVVTEFKYGAMLSSAFRGTNAIKYLKNWGPEWGLLDGASALAFIDNHQNQRPYGDSGDVLTYKSAKLYKMAIAFMLAWPYGITRVISSYYFTDPDAGPPANSDGTIKDVHINDDGSCDNGWVCEHRWGEVKNMVAFKNTVEGTAVDNWWDNGDMQIAFSRGNVGFIAFNAQRNVDIKQTLQTGIPQGIYCDLISGYKQNGSCSGKSVTVKKDETAYIQILSSEDNGMLTISSASKLN